MTGYGKSVAQADGQSFTIEVRSLNSKYLDLNLKVPGTFRRHEVAIRNMVSSLLIRGKIELMITTDQGGENGAGQLINKQLFANYHKELKALCAEHGLADDDLLSAILRLPDITKQDASDSISDEAWAQITPGIYAALDQMNRFRAQEGTELEKDLVERVKTIAELNKAVEVIENERVTAIRSRLKEHLLEVLESDQLDKNRLEQEMIFYIEKLDITEEIVRLRSHCDYFVTVVNEDELEKGKKLNFISQEIGREINTIGSKSNNSDMQKQVVRMKEQLEKIKEQLNNVL